MIGIPVQRPARRRSAIFGAAWFCAVLAISTASLSGRSLAAPDARPSGAPDPGGVLLFELSRARAAQLLQDVPDVSILADYQRMPLEGERPVFVKIGDIPPLLQKAFVAVEDRHFYQHKGIDFPRSSYTIELILAKSLLLTEQQNLDRKLLEMLTAERIGQTFSKDQVLEIYLNRIYLGLKAYGIGVAAEQYFDKALSMLQLDEIAYLAALPKAPQRHHPIRHAARALERRNWVLGRMAEDGYISAAQAAEAKAKPLSYGSSLQAKN
jgi:membrane peptidoglycan carboxypeptidase